MTAYQNGNWIEYADYAALQADFTQMNAWGRGLETELRLAQEALAALKAETVRKLEAAIPPVEAYIIKLEAENERLRKAGDGMELLHKYGPRLGNPFISWRKALNDWHAAKETQP